jgi:DNA-binding NtrC family response regulator
VLDPEPILVVAPEAEMRGTLAVAIAEETRRPVAAAPDAAEAARLARARRPGALVVDLGLEGDAAALRALSHEPSVAGCPIVATGPATARDAALAAGAAAFVAEPVDLRAVLAALAGAAPATAGHADRAA